MTWLQTYSGKQFFPLDPQAEDICIDDIAHSLSNQCRYSGHVIRFYSVAEHCVHVARNVSNSNKLAGLLHDAAEAYLVDIPRPVKRMLPEYTKMERAVESVIADVFRVQYPWPEEVHYADCRILHDEKLQLMAVEPAPWSLPAPPLGLPPLPCWSPMEAETMFLQTFDELT